MKILCQLLTTDTFKANKLASLVNYKNIPMNWEKQNRFVSSGWGLAAYTTFSTWPFTSTPLRQPTQSSNEDVIRMDQSKYYDLNESIPHLPSSKVPQTERPTWVGRVGGFSTFGHAKWNSGYKSDSGFSCFFFLLPRNVEQVIRPVLSKIMTSWEIAAGILSIEKKSHTYSGSRNVLLF